MKPDVGAQIRWGWEYMRRVYGLHPEGGFNYSAGAKLPAARAGDFAVFDRGEKGMTARPEVNP